MDYRVLWAVLGLALLTHGLYLGLDHNFSCDDTPSYLEPAKNLWNGLGYVNNLHEPEIWRPPGYPLLLALFLSGPLRPEYLVPVQHILCILLAVGVAAFAIRVTGSALVALAAGCVLSLDLATIVTANLLLSETLFTVFVAIGCWILYNSVSNPVVNVAGVVVAGLLNGFTVLVRPAGILYFAPLAIYIVFAQKWRAARPVLVFVACFLLFPMLLATRNSAKTGYFGVSTTGQYNLLANRAAGALAIQRTGNYFDNVIKVRHDLLAQTCANFTFKYRLDCPAAPFIRAQQAKFYGRTGLRILLRNLGSYLRSAATGIAYTIFGGGAEALAKMGHLSSFMAEFIVLLLTVPEACLAFLGCWYWSRRDKRLCWLLVSTVLYFVFIPAGAEAYSRYRVPVMPMYGLLTAGGAAMVVQAIRKTIRKA